MDIYERMPDGTLFLVTPLDKAKHQTADKALQGWVASEGEPGKHYQAMTVETAIYKALTKRVQVAEPMGAKQPEEKAKADPKPKAKAKPKAAPKK